MQCAKMDDATVVVTMDADEAMLAQAALRHHARGDRPRPEPVRRRARSMADALYACAAGFTVGQVRERSRAAEEAATVWRERAQRAEAELRSAEDDREEIISGTRPHGTEPTSARLSPDLPDVRGHHWRGCR